VDIVGAFAEIAESAQVVVVMMVQTAFLYIGTCLVGFDNGKKSDQNQVMIYENKRHFYST